MVRRVGTILGAAAIVALGAGVASAASMPAIPFSRGPGGYVSWFKILTVWLVFLAWVYSTDWVSRDAFEKKLNWSRWNPIVVGVFLVGLLLVWAIPYFWLLGFPLLLAAYIAPLVIYIRQRNSRVEDNQKVWTHDHLRWWIATRVQKIGIKMSAESRDPNVGGAPVKLVARGGPDEKTDSGRLVAARQSPGLPEARAIISDGLASRASAIMLDYTAGSVGVKHMVDGVWLPRERREREQADPALQALKLLAGLNPQERQKRQEGPFGVEYLVLKRSVFDKGQKALEEFKLQTTVELTKKLAADEVPPAQLQQMVARGVEEKVREKFASPVGPWTPVDKEKLPKLPGLEPLSPITSVEPMKCKATIACQGAQGAERVLIQFEVQSAPLVTLDDVGMRSKLQEQLKEVLDRPRGFVLLSAMPTAGLRTTTAVVLHSMDRFVREFVAVEDEANRYRDVENVPVTTYKSSEKQSPATILPKLFREEPNVVVVRDLVDAQTVSVLCRETAEEDRLMIGTIRAKDCAEALLRVLALKVPPEEFAQQVTAVTCQRLIRKLCDKCKEAYGPPPQVLQQMGIPEGRIKVLYRPPPPRVGDDKMITCVECGGVGYKGQTAIFEVLVVDDTVRKVLCSSPKLELVRQAARKAGMKSLQEEGVLLVARGVTSLPELMRVLKQ